MNTHISTSCTDTVWVVVPGQPIDSMIGEMNVCYEPLDVNDEEDLGK
jgi:hypothetical protein